MRASHPTHRSFPQKKSGFEVPASVCKRMHHARNSRVDAQESSRQDRKITLLIFTVPAAQKELTEVVEAEQVDRYETLPIKKHGKC